MKTYADFNFSPGLTRALDKVGFTSPTEVQTKTIPSVLDNRDVLVTAQTGSGKTAAFSIPIIEKMLLAKEVQHPKRALIIAPTRELAEQIGKVVQSLTWGAKHLKCTVIIGGTSYGPQLAGLKMNPAFVIGTPGRLNDHLKTGALRLADFQYLVIDEADRLLDMGFEPQVEEIIKRMPPVHQTCMFSATLPEGVKKLVAKYLRNPVRIEIGQANRPVAAIKQDVIETTDGEKRTRLSSEIDKLAGTIIIFTRTRSRADSVAKLLHAQGHKAEALHGDLSQNKRRRVTDRFRAQETRILVATDIAARGLDIHHIEHVINFDLPAVPEDYVHRIGRTGRNGAEGHSLSLVTPAEQHLWIRILRLTGQPLPPEARTSNRFKDSGKGRGPRPERHAKTQSYLRTGEKPTSKPGSRSDSRPAGKAAGARRGPSSTTAGAQGAGKPSRGPGGKPSNGRPSRGGPSRGGSGSSRGGNGGGSRRSQPSR